MKKIALLILTVLLMFTTACSGNGMSETTTATTIAATTTATTATTATTSATTTATTAAPVIIPTDIPPVTVDLIAEGYPTDNVRHIGIDANDGILYVESMDRYYFFAEDYLMHMDGSSMEPAPLCAKEGCLHNAGETAAEKLDCEAYFPSGYSKLLYFRKDRLYVTHCTAADDAYVLSSMVPDGTGRREELRLGAIYGMPLPVYEAIHRGRLYYVWNRMDQGGKFVSELWTCDLDDLASGPVLLYQAESNVPGMWPIRNLRVYGNYLYLRKSVELIDEIVVQSETDGGVQGFVHKIVAGESLLLDLTSGEWTVLEDPEGCTLLDSWFVDGKLLARYQTIEEQKRLDSEEYIFYLWEPDGSAYEEVDNAAWTDTIDGDYIYQKSDATPQTTVLTVCDLERNSIGEIMYEDLFGSAFEVDGSAVEAETEGASFGISPASDEYLILKTTEHLKWNEGTDVAQTVRHVCYYLRYEDLGAQKVEPQEFFRYEETDYQGA